MINRINGRSHGKSRHNSHRQPRFHGGKTEHDGGGQGAFDPEINKPHRDHDQRFAKDIAENALLDVDLLCDDFGADRADDIGEQNEPDQAQSLARDGTASQMPRKESQ